MMDHVRHWFKRWLRTVAVVLDRATGGKITPNGVTIAGLVMHVPIAWLITQHTYANYLWAGVLLIVFGLFDTLDGQLAQVQKRESYRGMLLDSVTDRIKEVLLYSGVAYAFAATSSSKVLAAVPVAALGCSLLTSYLNAIGDTIMAKQPAGGEHATNKAFRGSLFPFEIRMAVLVAGLLFNVLAPAVIVITLGAALTAASRLHRVYRRLANA